MDCLVWLRNIIIVDVWEIRKHKLYDSDSSYFVESGWNLWVWIVGVVSRRWVWLMDGIYGCG